MAETAQKLAKASIRTVATLWKYRILNNLDLCNGYLVTKPVSIVIVLALTGMIQMKKNGPTYRPYYQPIYNPLGADME